MDVRQRKQRAMKRNIVGLAFGFLDVLSLKKDSAGRIVEYTPSLPPGVKPNRYAAGPFCSFERHKKGYRESFRDRPEPRLYRRPCPVVYACAQTILPIRS